MTSSEPELFGEKKGEVRVLLLGPYGLCKEMLIQIRDFLRNVGFNQTQIVEDLPNLDFIPAEPEATYFLGKSRHYIREWAQILIFHFTNECNCNSVLLELAVVEQEVPQKCFFSTILRRKDYDLGTLFEGAIEPRRISVFPYDGEEQLLKKAFAACFYSLDNLRIHNMI